jgi:hypothetical protein
MPFIQESVDRYHAAAFEGAIADSQLTNMFSRLAEEAIPFGKVLLQGAADRTVKLPDGGAEAFVGLSVRDQSTGALSRNQFATGDSVRVMDKGVIWVRVGANVDAGERAAYLDATGAIVPVGTASSTAMDDAWFETSAASGELAKLKLA